MEFTSSRISALPDLIVKAFAFRPAFAVKKCHQKG